MKYTVFHAKEPNFGMGKPPEFKDYEKVAEVETTGLESVFRLTNHINHSWTQNPEVRWFKGGGVRSTSVGDIVIDGNGKKFRCEMAEWAEIVEPDE
jgi:hypothetical protein